MDVDEHLGYSIFLPLINSVPMNSSVQVFLSGYTSVGYLTRSGISELYDNSGFNF